MSFSVVINIPGTGDVNLTNYSGENLTYNSSFKKKVTVHSKKFKTETARAYFSFEPRAAIMNAILSLDRDQNISVTITEDAAAWFKGYIRPISKFRNTNTGRDEMSVECVDVSWVLHEKMEGYIERLPSDGMKVCDTTTTAESMVHWILTLAGFTGSVTADDILVDVDYFLERDKEYFEILSELLFCYHRSFYFDESGDFVMYDWGPTSAPSTATLTEANMIRHLDIDRDTKVPDTPVVVYREVEKKNGIEMGSWSGPVILAHTNVVTLNSGSMTFQWDGYPEPTASITCATSFDVDFTLDISEECVGVIQVWMDSLVYKREASTGILDTWNDDPGPVWYYQTVRDHIEQNVYNNIFYGARRTSEVTPTDRLDRTRMVTNITVERTGINEKYVAMFDQIAFMGYLAIADKKKTKGPDIGPGEKEWDAPYAFTVTHGDNLATALSRNLEFGDLSYMWRSQEDLTLGGYYTITNTLANVSGLVRIVTKETEYVPGNQTFYRYIGIRTQALGSVVTGVIAGQEPVVAPPPVGPFPIEGEGLGSTDDHAPHEDGLFFYSDRFGFWDETDGEWKTYFDVDGTFQAKGDASNLIQWNGTKLSIYGDLFLSGDSELDGTVTTGGAIASTNFDTGIEGWQISADGDAEFNSLIVRKDIIETAIAQETIEAPPAWLSVIPLDSSGEDFDGTAADVTGTFSTAQSKFDYGSSLFAGAASFSYETYNAYVSGYDMNDEIVGASAWVYVDTLPTGGPAKLNEIYYSSGVYFKLLITTTGTLQLWLVDGSTTHTITTTGTIAVDGWHHYAYWWDGSDARIMIDGGTVETTAKTIAAVAAYNYMVRFTGINAATGLDLYTAVIYQQEGCIIQPSIGTTSPENTMRLHYTNNAKWQAGTSAEAFNIVGDLNVTGDLMVAGDVALPTGYIYGLETSLDTDTQHDINIAAGKCRSNDDTENIELATEITKQIDATWAAGDDAGGNFTVSVAANTTYHLFLIKKDSDGTVDAGWDTTITCNNIPTGYTKCRRIASFYTDGSSNIRKYVQHGDYFEYMDLTWFDLNTTAPATTSTLQAVSVPADIRPLAKLRCHLIHTVNAGLYIEPDPGSLSDTANNRAAVRTYASGEANTNDVEIQVSTTRYVRYKCSVGTVTAAGFTAVGYTDYRGQYRAI